MSSYAPFKSKRELQLSSLNAEIPTIHHFLRLAGVCSSSIHLPPPAYKLLYLCQTMEGGKAGNEGKVTQRSRNKHLFNTVKFPDLFALSCSHILHQDFTFSSLIRHIHYSVSMSWVNILTIHILLQVFINHPGICVVISCDSIFLKWHFWFTTLPFQYFIFKDDVFILILYLEIKCQTNLSV